MPGRPLDAGGLPVAQVSEGADAARGRRSVCVLTTTAHPCLAFMAKSTSPGLQSQVPPNPADYLSTLKWPYSVHANLYMRRLRREDLVQADITLICHRQARLHMRFRTASECFIDGRQL